MKIKYKISVFLWSIFLILLVSCSAENDEFGPANPKENLVDYFPLNLENYWEYEREEHIINHYFEENFEKLTVTDSIHEFETPGFLFSSDVNSKKQGIATQLLTGGTLNKVEGKLVFNGNFIYHFPVIEDSLVIPLENALILHQNREQGYVLSDVEGEIIRNLQIEQTQIPVKYHYSLQIIQGKSSTDNPSLVVDYEDVITSKLILKLSGTATGSSQTSVDIIPEQEILQTTFFFAKDVGIFRTNSDINLEFINLSEFSLSEILPIIGWKTQELKSFRLK